MEACSGAEMAVGARSGAEVSTEVRSGMETAARACGLLDGWLGARSSAEKVVGGMDRSSGRFGACSGTGAWDGDGRGSAEMPAGMPG